MASQSQSQSPSELGSQQVTERSQQVQEEGSAKPPTPPPPTPHEEQSEEAPELHSEEASEEASEVVSEVASLPSRISKCRWFFLELKEQWSEENTYEVCKYVWVLSKSMSKKAQWIGCNYNKAKDGFIAIIYFKHPIDVRIFSDLIRETWENPNVRPLQRTDGPYTMQKMVVRLLRDRRNFNERGCNKGVPYFSNLGSPSPSEKESDVASEPDPELHY